MVSPELLRRYPFFAGLTHEQLVVLAKAADELELAEGQILFREGQDLDYFYLVLSGQVAITIDLLAHGEQRPIPEATEKQREIIVSTVNTGDILAWSALVPPYRATSNSKSLTPCQLIAFECAPLRKAFEEDSRFGYLMVLRLAQVVRDRLHDMHQESLASAVQSQQLA